jgi:hypothetical protein
MREIRESAKSPESDKPPVLLEGQNNPVGSISQDSLEKVANSVKKALSGLQSLRDGALVFTSLDDAGDAKKEKEAKEAAEKAAKALIADAKAGKWGKESKETFKKIFDEAKSLGATPDEMFKTLNQVGAGINDALKKAGSKNTVGIAQATEKGEVTFRMTLNGPKINKADNVIAILRKKDIDTVHTVGKMKEEKKD